MLQQYGQFQQSVLFPPGEGGEEKCPLTTTLGKGGYQITQINMWGPTKTFFGSCGLTTNTIVWHFNLH